MSAWVALASPPPLHASPPKMDVPWVEASAPRDSRRTPGRGVRISGLPPMPMPPPMPPSPPPMPPFATRPVRVLAIPCSALFAAAEAAEVRAPGGTAGDISSPAAPRVDVGLFSCGLSVLRRRPPGPTPPASSRPADVAAACIRRALSA